MKNTASIDFIDECFKTAATTFFFCFLILGCVWLINRAENSQIINGAVYNFQYTKLIQLENEFKNLGESVKVAHSKAYYLDRRLNEEIEEINNY